MSSTGRKLSSLGLCLFATVALSLTTAKIATAQQPILAQLYGNGVHAFFAGDYVLAHEELTASIDGGNLDPRVFYFRALAYQCMGRPEQAGKDFERGAQLEMDKRSHAYPIARSLERIQGRARLDLESYRTAARMAVYKKERDQHQRRFGGGDAPAKLPPPTSAKPAKGADDKKVNPFADDDPVDEGEEDTEMEFEEGEEDAEDIEDTEEAEDGGAAPSPFEGGEEVEEEDFDDDELEDEL